MGPHRPRQPTRLPRPWDSPGKNTGVRPHRRQPNRPCRPWDSPGKNTGVGCHFLLQCMKVKSESEVAQSCPTLSDSMDCSLPGSSIHGIFQARVLEWSGLHARGEGERVLALESREGTRASPRDGGAWWAAIYGVAQSWTRLKRLSSSSSSRAALFQS